MAVSQVQVGAFGVGALARSARARVFEPLIDSLAEHMPQAEADVFKKSVWCDPHSSCFGSIQVLASLQILVAPCLSSLLDRWHSMAWLLLLGWVVPKENGVLLSEIRSIDVAATALRNGREEPWRLGAPRAMEPWRAKSHGALAPTAYGGSTVR